MFDDRFDDIRGHEGVARLRCSSQDLGAMHLGVVQIPGETMVIPFVRHQLYN